MFPAKTKTLALSNWGKARSIKSTKETLSTWSLSSQTARRQVKCVPSHPLMFPSVRGLEARELKSNSAVCGQRKPAIGFKHTDQEYRCSSKTNKELVVAWGHWHKHRRGSNSGQFGGLHRRGDAEVLDGITYIPSPRKVDNQDSKALLGTCYHPLSQCNQRIHSKVEKSISILPIVVINNIFGLYCAGFQFDSACWSKLRHHGLGPIQIRPGLHTRGGGVLLR